MNKCITEEVKIAVQEEKINSIEKRLSRIEKTTYMILFLLVGAGIVNLDQAKQFISFIKDFFA